jgi:hypothetical protein
MFPFTVRYSRRFKKKVSVSQTEEIIAYIKDFLSKKTVDEVVVGGNTVTYKSWHYKFRWAHDILVPVNKGIFQLEFKEEGCRLTYQFYLQKWFLVSLAISLLAGVPVQSFLIAVIFFGAILITGWLIAIIRHRLMLSEIVFDIEVLIIEKKEKDNSFSQTGELDYRLPGAVDWTPEDGEWKREGGDWTPDLKEEN